MPVGADRAEAEVVQETSRHWSVPDPGGPPTAVSGVRCCTRSAAPPRRRSPGAPPRCRSPAPDAPIAAARRRSPGAPPLALVRHSAEAGEHEHPETPRQCVTATADGARPPCRCTASWLGCAGELLWTTPRQRPRPWLPAIPALARGSTESRSHSSRRSVSSCPQLEALLHTDEKTYSHRVLFSASCSELL